MLNAIHRRRSDQNIFLATEARNNIWKNVFFHIHIHPLLREGDSSYSKVDTLCVVGGALAHDVM